MIRVRLVSPEALFTRARTTRQGIDPALLRMHRAFRDAARARREIAPAAHRESAGSTAGCGAVERIDRAPPRRRGPGSAPRWTSARRSAAGSPKLAPCRAQDRCDLERRCDDARALQRGGAAGQHETVVGGRTRPGTTAPAGRRRQKKRTIAPMTSRGEPIRPIEATGVLDHQRRARAADARRRSAMAAAPPIELPISTHALQRERVEQPAEQLGIARRAGRHAIVAGTTLPGPVDRDDAVARAKPRPQPAKVTRAMADGVQTDDRRSVALVVVRQAARRRSSASSPRRAGSQRRSAPRPRALGRPPRPPPPPPSVVPLPSRFAMGCMLL